MAGKRNVKKEMTVNENEQLTNLEIPTNETPVNESIETTDRLDIVDLANMLHIVEQIILRNGVFNADELEQILPVRKKVRLALEAISPDVMKNYPVPTRG